MQRVIIAALGVYTASVIKPELVESLCAGIEQHMKVYGFKEIQIQIGPWIAEEPEDSCS